jgi:hypothetical protein
MYGNEDSARRLSLFSYLMMKFGFGFIWGI